MTPPPPISDEFRNSIGFLHLYYDDWKFDLHANKRDDWQDYWKESRYFAYLENRLEHP
jgi:hypothetical protein